MTKLVFCRRVKLEEDEVARLTNSSMAFSQPYLSYVFSEKDGSMCVDDYESLFLQEVSCTRPVYLVNKLFLFSVLVAYCVMS